MIRLSGDLRMMGFFFILFNINQQWTSQLLNKSVIPYFQLMIRQTEIHNYLSLIKKMQEKKYFNTPVLFEIGQFSGKNNIISSPLSKTSRANSFFQKINKNRINYNKSLDDKDTKQIDPSNINTTQHQQKSVKNHTHANFLETGRYISPIQFRPKSLASINTKKIKKDSEIIKTDRKQSVQSYKMFTDPSCKEESEPKQRASFLINKKKKILNKYKTSCSQIFIEDYHSQQKPRKNIYNIYCQEISEKSKKNENQKLQIAKKRVFPKKKINCSGLLITQTIYSPESRSKSPEKSGIRHKDDLKQKIKKAIDNKKKMLTQNQNHRKIIYCSHKMKLNKIMGKNNGAFLINNKSIEECELSGWVDLNYDENEDFS